MGWNPALAGRKSRTQPFSRVHTPWSPTQARPAWKAVIEKYPDRFLMGIDVWAARLFEAPTLDKLMTWTRRILGELKPDVAERVAAKNAAAIFKLE